MSDKTRIKELEEQVEALSRRDEPDAIMMYPEVETELRISKSTIKRLVKDGKLKSKRLGNQIVFMRSEVDRFLAELPDGKE